ncbi:hypothetical protein [Streptomyces sp. NPDC056296]|uniref:hypothetical protein n=1 Tax=Streptomyces sp. NPDC056296 TaxID=3345775 RepID=UPI0035DA5AAE
MGAGRILLTDLIDDGCLFSATGLPLADRGMATALTRHRRDRAVRHGQMTHRLMCPASRLDDLRRALPPDDLIRVTVVADVDVTGLAPAMARCQADPRIVLTAVEYPLALSGRADTASGLSRIARLVEETEVRLFAEPARLDDVPRLVDAVHGLRPGCRVGLRLRCAGPGPHAFAPPDAYARALVRAAAGRLPVKAVGCAELATRNFRAAHPTHFGVLNLLVAAARAACGGDAERVAADLVRCDPSELVELVCRLGPEAARATRRLLVGCASSDPMTTVADCDRLGLWTQVSTGAGAEAETISETRSRAGAAAS